MIPYYEKQNIAPQLEAISKWLRSRDELERARAEDALSKLAPGDLIKLMALERRQRLRRQRIIVSAVGGYVLLMVLVAIVSHKFMMVTYIGSFTGMIAAATRFSPAHQRAAQELAKYDDLDGLGALVDALEIPGQEVRAAVTASLTRILPRLRVSDSRRLSAAQRRMLKKQLIAPPVFKDRETTVLFLVSLLKALEQVGDETFLESVESLAEGRTDWRELRIQEAARECLPFLRQRIENERLSHDLLRGSAAVGASDPASLLRPVESSGQTEPAQLLRPSSAE